MAGLFLPDLTPEQIANARKWIAALRSGKYKQGYGSLYRNQKWCVNGVGVDILQIEPLGARLCLTPAEAAAMGLQSQTGRFDSDRLSLMSLNDQYQKTFPQIADVIEQELALVTEVTV